MSRCKPVLSATVAWLVFAIVAVACTGRQEAFLTPRLGPRMAHIVGTLIVVSLMAIAIMFYVRRLQASRPAVLFLVGVYWLVLTVACEAAFACYVWVHPWRQLLSLHDLSRGNLWILPLLTVLFGPILAGVQHHKTISRLILLQIAGILLAAATSMYEIESIIASGAALFLTGVTIAVASYRADRPAGLHFGLAAPTMTILCFSLICGLNWGPNRAQTPISWLLLVFALLSIPLGIRAFTEAQGLQRVRPRRPVQFSIADLLWTTLVVAALLGAYRMQSQPAIALAVLAVYAAIAGHAVWRFHTGRMSVNESGDAARPAKNLPPEAGVLHPDCAPDRGSPSDTLPPRS